jgi:hypothetical protein
MELSVMTEQSIAVRPAEAGAIMENVIAKGDLAALSAEERSRYYLKVCESMGLNPLTQPFQYIELDKKLTLYATRSATDQLRSNRSISIRVVSREVVGNVYVVTVEATDATGRADTSIGAVALVKEDGEWKTAQSGKRYFAGNGTLKPLGPDDLANAYMKAETKAKRRVTLSISGLGWLDESELETIPSSRLNEPSASVRAEPHLASLPSPGSDVEPVNDSKAMRRLHAVGADRDLDHEELRRVAQLRHKGLKSLTELDEGALTALATEIETASEDELALWTTNWEERIARAVSQADLDVIAEELARGGIGRATRPDLTMAWKERKIALQNGELPGMPIDADRYTA